MHVSLLVFLFHSDITMGYAHCSLSVLQENLQSMSSPPSLQGNSKYVGLLAKVSSRGDGIVWHDCALTENNHGKHSVKSAKFRNALSDWLLGTYSSQVQSLRFN